MVLFDLQWFWASIHMDACADESFYLFTAMVGTNRQTDRVCALSRNRK